MKCLGLCFYAVVEPEISGAVIGGAVGGGLGFTVAVLLIIFFVWR